MSCNLEEKQYLDLIKNIIENGYLELAIKLQGSAQHLKPIHL